MKILQIVTLLTPDNAYGGPLRVALNQARQLKSMGHEVSVLVGCYGYAEPPPQEVDGVPVSTFRAYKFIPKAGFAGMGSPTLYAHVARHAQTFDVVHVHLARDLIVAPAALAAYVRRIPLVLQTHGMLNTSKRKSARVFDVFLTRRLIEASASVLWLTEYERKALHNLFGNRFKSERLINGVPPQEPGDERNSHLKPLSHNQTVRVLYLARLHRRKRPVAFVNAAKGLIERGIIAQFRLVGPDEGEAKSVLEIAESVRDHVMWLGGMNPEQTSSIMTSSDIYCLPSVDEPFPMSVLEAMSCGLPCIVTDSCGLAPFIRMANAGIVVNASNPNELEEALVRLIEDPGLRHRMSFNARRLVESEFSMDKVGLQLESVYKRALVTT